MSRVCHRSPIQVERVGYAIKLQDKERAGLSAWLTLNSHWRLLSSGRSLWIRRRGDRALPARCASIWSVFAKDINKIPLSTSINEFRNSLFAAFWSTLFRSGSQSEFFDRLRQDEQILVAGPSTLSALLNSLSVGFKTLNISKRVQMT